MFTCDTIIPRYSFHCRFRIQYHRLVLHIQHSIVLTPLPLFPLPPARAINERIHPAELIYSFLRSTSAAKLTCFTLTISHHFLEKSPPPHQIEINCIPLDLHTLPPSSSPISRFSLNCYLQVVFTRDHRSTDSEKGTVWLQLPSLSCSHAASSRRQETKDKQVSFSPLPCLVVALFCGE